MKYLLMIYGNKQTWAGFTPADGARAVAAQDAFNAKFAATGELLGAYGLADAALAKVVRVRDGASAVTDGPYLETKEYLASYCMVDVADEARALEIAAEMPFATVGGVEVWPVRYEAASTS
jgi:hypothetical protein